MQYDFFTYEAVITSVFINIINNKGLKDIDNYLVKNAITSCYLAGETNSGKSSLINKLIELHNSNVNEVTTSHNINTTVDFLPVKLNEQIINC